MRWIPYGGWRGFGRGWDRIYLAAEPGYAVIRVKLSILHDRMAAMDNTDPWWVTMTCESRVQPAPPDVSPLPFRRVKRSFESEEAAIAFVERIKQDGWDDVLMEEAL